MIKKKRVYRYKAGDRISNYTLLEESVDKKYYWKMRCDCGRQLFRCLESAKHSKNCQYCRASKGNLSPYWKRYGEISHEVFKIYKFSAAAKNLPFTVTIEYLWELFLKQDRKCAFTGELLLFNKSGKEKKDKTASPDRIDSTKGYEEGNIQWVHRDVNKLKKNFTDARFLEICNRVANYRKS